MGCDLGIARGRSTLTCPVNAWHDWVAASHVQEGAVFRRVRRGDVIGADRLTDKSVALVVKRVVTAIGLEPKGFSAHSLRSGVITSAALAGASINQIMNQSRHKSVDVARSYIRVSEIWDNNISSILL